MPAAKRAPKPEDKQTDWNEVIAKSLAFLVVNSADWRDKKVTERAAFLMSLGLGRKDAAAVLGSTDESLRVNLGKLDRTNTKGKSTRRG
jgi:hypothetical protein